MGIDSLAVFKETYYGLSAIKASSMRLLWLLLSARSQRHVPLPHHTGAAVNGAIYGEITAVSFQRVRDLAAPSCVKTCACSPPPTRTGDGLLKVEVQPRVSLCRRRCFLRTGRARASVGSGSHELIPLSILGRVSLTH